MEPSSFLYAWEWIENLNPLSVLYVILGSHGGEYDFRIIAFCDVMLCSLIHVYWCIREHSCSCLLYPEAGITSQ